MADKYSSKGTLLQREIATVMTTVASVTSISGPDAETQFFDATDLLSDDVEDGEPTGQGTPGSVSGDLWLDPLDSTHQVLFADLASRQPVDWQIVFPATGAPAIVFNGTLSSFTPQASVGDGLKASYGIKLRSLATYPTTPAGP